MNFSNTGIFERLGNYSAIIRFPFPIDIFCKLIQSVLRHIFRVSKCYDLVSFSTISECSDLYSSVQAYFNVESSGCSVI